MIYNNRATKTILEQLQTHTAAKNNLRSKLTHQLILLENLLNNSKKTRAHIAALPLFNKLCLLAVDINKNYHEADSENRAEQLIKCIKLINSLIIKPGNEIYQQELHKLAFLGAYEKSAYEEKTGIQYYPALGKYYFSLSLDKIINSVNSIRTFVFGSPFSRSRLATHNFISDHELHHFILMTQQSTANRVLGKLLVYDAVLTADHNLYLNAETKEAFEIFLQNKPVTITNAVVGLRDSLHRFAQQVDHAQHNEVINTAAMNAFLASQDRVLELLNEKKLSLEKIQKLTECFNQTAMVIATPGQIEEVRKLEILVDKSDYKLRKRNRENTCYALIHILVSTILFSLAVADAIASHGAELITHGFILGAEILSLSVGGGQLYHFSDSQIEKTLFSETMHDFIKVAHLKTNHNQDWKPGIDPATVRKSILEALAPPSDASDASSKAISSLLDTIETLRKIVENPGNDLMRQQGLEVLHSGEDLAIDLLRDKKQSLVRIKKLQESIETAISVVTNPYDFAAVNHLIELSDCRGYEKRNINKAGLIIGFSMLLISLAIFAVTITGTVFSGGTVAGTIISPIMTTALAIHKIIDSCKKQDTQFTSHAKALGQFALFGCSEVKEKPDTVFCGNPLFTSV